MRFPHTLTVIRASGEDEYGNAAASWESPTVRACFAFVLEGRAMLPVGSDILPGDRVMFGGETLAVKGKPRTVRSPSKDIFIKVELTRIPDV